MNGIDNDILRYDHDDDCHGHYHQHHHMTFVENVHFQQRKQNISNICYSVYRMKKMKQQIIIIIINHSYLINR